MKSQIIIIVTALFILGLRSYIYLIKPLPYKDGDSIRITSKISGEPVNYDGRQYIKLEGLKIYLPPYPQLFYGDRVVIEGRVNTEKSRLDKPTLISVLPSSGLLYQLRTKLLGFYETSLPAPHSGLVAGTVLGSKSGTSGDFYDKLKSTSTAHVVVASGMNVSLVAGFMIPLLSVFAKRKIALLFTLVGIWIYAILAGFDSPIIRAAVMGSIAIYTQETGRLSTAINSLIATGILMLIVNPGWIADVGFLLSFFATLSLIIFEKRINKLFKFVPGILREGLSTSTAAQIGVAPILFITFGQFNILSPVINALIIWTVPSITIVGIIGGIISLVVPAVGKIILLLVYPLTWWFVTIVELFQ